MLLRLRARWLIVLMLLLALARAPRLLASGLNNVAARALLPEWRRVGEQVAFPRCGAWLQASGAHRNVSLALKLDRVHPRALLNAGRAAWLAGDCSLARANWERAAIAAPRDRMAAFWLFWASGVSDLPSGLSARELARYANKAGGRAARSGAVEASLDWHELAFRLDPNRQTAAALASAYRRGKRPEEAPAVWREVAAALPAEDPERWWALAQAAEWAEDWEGAAQAYGQGAVLADVPYEYWMRQAGAFAKLARARDQEAAYHRAIEACPDCLVPYLALGHLWRGHGQHEGALAWYEEAARIAPRNATPPYYQAQVLHEMGRVAQAADRLARAIELHKGQPWGWAVQLGDWRLELGDRAGALAAYRQALEWRPDDAAIRERIERVRE